MNTQNLVSLLRLHQAHDIDEQAHRASTLAFVERNGDRWWKRATLDGHVTASAWVVNAARTHALLLHHAKLDRWVQPGGHIDDADASADLAALREAREETGLGYLALAGNRLFDVDVHDIPARGDEPAHLHYDLRYLIISPDVAAKISGESLEARWMAMTELAGAKHERSIARMAEKTLGITK
jgi:8-oxo-dGTP pyrophosphatase MutT (NUDIX family)